MTTRELESLIEGQVEYQGLDFKADCIWDVGKLAKDMLAMANCRDGGLIVIGVDEVPGAFRPKGVSEPNRATFKIDIMRDQISKYADPPIDFRVHFPTDSGGRNFVVIQVDSFKETPVICKRSMDPVLKESTIYYRNSNRRVESAAISNINDLRDLIELAAFRIYQRRRAFGYTIPDGLESVYEQELKTIPETDIIKKIKSKGYIETRITPSGKQEFSSLQECLQIVERARVRDPWYVPYIPYADSDGSVHPADGCYESESDLGARKEFWRMYLSQQFYMLNGLPEDWYKDDRFRSKLADTIESGVYLTYFTSTVQYITQVMQFVERLAQFGLYKTGLKVTVTFNNMRGRRLYLDQSDRYPFMEPNITGAQKIEVCRDLSFEEISTNSIGVANELILKVFDSFGYSPTSDAVRIDQLKVTGGR